LLEPQRRAAADMRFDIPVEPDADTAREWARDELAKREYQQGTGSNWLERFFNWIQDLLNGMGGGVGDTFGGWGVVGIALAAAAIVALIIWLVMGPLQRSRRRGKAEEELGDLTLSAADLLAAAKSAAAAGNWETAVIEAYRALIRSLDEREVIDAKPGMTAFEAALLASEAIPAIASDIAIDADVFDAVRYGHLAATAEHYNHVLATREAAKTARVVVPA